MKKKLVLGLLVFVALFAITGCGSNKDESQNSSKSNESNNTSSNVATVVTCKNTNKDDGMAVEIFDAVVILNFDKDDMLIDGKKTTTYEKESTAQDNYKYDKEAADAGAFESATIDKNVVTITFTNKSKTYGESLDKKQQIEKYENAGWTCE